MAEAVSGSFSPTPGTSTLTKLKKEVASFILAPSDTDALEVAEMGVKEAIRKVNGRNWKFMRTTDDISTVASTRTYSLQASFLAPEHCELLNSSSNPNGMLHWLAPKEFNRTFRERSSTGSPSHYTVQNARDTGVIELSRPPSSGFVTSYPTLRLRYYAAVAFPTDAAVLDVPVWLEPAVSWWAKMYIASVYDERKVGIASRFFSDCWRDAVAHDLASQVEDYS